MFVRRKVVKEKHYFQVVENHRVGGRVRQVILASLGAWPSVAAAKAAIPARLQELERLITANRELQSEADSRRPPCRSAGSFRRSASSTPKAGSASGFAGPRAARHVARIQAYSNQPRDRVYDWQMRSRNAARGVAIARGSRPKSGRKLCPFLVRSIFSGNSPSRPPGRSSFRSRIFAKTMCAINAPVARTRSG